MAKTIEVAEKYGVDASKLMADVMAMDLTGQAEFDKAFALRASKGSEPVFKFNATIKAGCTVADLFARAAQPLVINWQNSHRKTKAETLEQANARLAALPKALTITVTALNEREAAELDVDAVVAKADVAQAQAMITALEAKLKALGIDLNAQRTVA